MRKLSAIFIFAISISFVACKGHVKEVEESIKLNEEVIVEMGKKIDANPNESGVDDARKVFESRKVEMKAKSDASRDAVNNGKVSGDQLKTIVDSGVARGKMFDQIRSKFGNNVSADQKFTLLVNDFNAMFK